MTYEQLKAPTGEPILAAQVSSKRQNPQIDSLTISDLYDRIAGGFGNLRAEELFIAPKEVQANPQFLNLGDQLVTVVDLESARAALATIIGNGEGEAASGSAGCLAWRGFRRAKEL